MGLLLDLYIIIYYLFTCVHISRPGLGLETDQDHFFEVLVLVLVSTLLVLVLVLVSASLVLVSVLVSACLVLVWSWSRTPWS